MRGRISLQRKSLRRSCSSSSAHSQDRVGLNGGLLLANKPEGRFSRRFGEISVQKFLLSDDCRVPEAKRKVSKKERRRQRFKIGHHGTLDPFACGLLPVAFGNATRLLPYLQFQPKRYIARLKLGIRTDTADKTGKVVETGEPSWSMPSEEKLSDICAQFTGKLQQQPSKFSAIKFCGQRAYQLARRGKDFDLPFREVEIKKISCMPVDDKELQIDLTCASGTYVRALGEDLAKAMGTVGHLTFLKRLQCGRFHLEETYDEDRLCVFYTEELMDFFPKIQIKRRLSEIKAKDRLPWRLPMLFDGDGHVPNAAPISLVCEDDVLSLIQNDSEDAKRKKYRYLVNFVRF